MKTTLLTEVTVGEICEGFVYNELEGKGLFGWGGKLVIQPEYQRNYIYADGKKDVAVVEETFSNSNSRRSSIGSTASSREPRTRCAGSNGVGSTRRITRTPTAPRRSGHG